MRPTKPVRLMASLHAMTEVETASFWQAIHDFVEAFTRDQIAKKRAASKGNLVAGEQASPVTDPT
jgi:hypothetical protein